MSAFVKSFGVNQFNKNFVTIDSEKNKRNNSIYSNIKTVQNIYRPQRYYRRKNAPPDDKEARIQITILEYGRRTNITVPSRQNDVSPEVLEDQKVEEVCSVIIGCFWCYFFIIFLWCYFLFVFENA